jgi:hypothetical protein
MRADPLCARTPDQASSGGLDWRPDTGKDPGFRAGVIAGVSENLGPDDEECECSLGFGRA